MYELLQESYKIIETKHTVTQYFLKKVFIENSMVLPVPCTPSLPNEEHVPVMKHFNSASG